MSHAPASAAKKKQGGKEEQEAKVERGGRENDKRDIIIYDMSAIKASERHINGRLNAWSVTRLPDTQHRIKMLKLKGGRRGEKLQNCNHPANDKHPMHFFAKIFVI